LNGREISALNLVSVLLLAYLRVLLVSAQLTEAQVTTGLLKVEKIAKEDNQTFLLANGIDTCGLSRDNLSALKPDPAKSNFTCYYRWDGVRFAKGLYIKEIGRYYKYPHPDRDYYWISPFRSWSMVGNKLMHIQLDQSASQALARIPLTTILAAVIAFIGAKIATALIGTGIAYPIGAFVGTIIGIFLGVKIMPYTIIGRFTDEFECIWWWISKEFVEWLANNTLHILFLTILCPVFATSVVMSIFLECGYLRIGSITFYDAIGAGSPEQKYPTRPYNRTFYS
jgi:hypothetical protein